MTHLSEPLGILFDDFNSDKQNTHYYGAVYQWMMESLVLRCGRPLRLLEIGISLDEHQGSFQAWQSCAEIALVVGVDLLPYRGHVQDSNAVVLGDAYTCEMLENLGAAYPDGFDLIIDDGPHVVDSQLFFLREYAMLCAEGGYLVCEDVWRWEVIREVQSIPNTLILETGWNDIHAVQCESVRQLDSRLVIRKCEGNI